MPPQLPRHRSALHDADDLTAELAVDDRPPRDKGNERYLARQDTAIHEVSKIIAPHRSGLASSRRLDVMSRDVVESVEGYAANRRVVSVVVVEVEPAGQRQASFGL